MTFADTVKKWEHAATVRVIGSTMYGPVANFFNLFQGRSTFFGILFAAEGLVLMIFAMIEFAKGKDLGSLAAFTAALAGFNGLIGAIIFAHSCKEDWAAIRQQQIDKGLVPASTTSTATATVQS